MIGYKTRTLNGVDVLNVDGSLFITVQAQYVEAFQKLISRGANCWDHAPPEIKKLIDLITEGTVQQAYDEQDSSNVTPLPSREHKKAFREALAIVNSKLNPECTHEKVIDHWDAGSHKFSYCIKCGTEFWI